MQVLAHTPVAIMCDIQLSYIARATLMWLQITCNSSLDTLVSSPGLSTFSFLVQTSQWELCWGHSSWR